MRGCMQPQEITLYNNKNNRGKIKNPQQKGSTYSLAVHYLTQSWLNIVEPFRGLLQIWAFFNGRVTNAVSQKTSSHTSRKILKDSAVQIP